MYRERFVIDTSAITCTIRTEHFEKDLKKIIKLVSDARVRLNISCYIPYPSVYAELAACLKMREIPDGLLTDIDTWFIKKTPNRFDVKISGEIFHDYIGDMRDRMNKGLRIAEEAVRKVTHKRHHPPVIKVLRDKYKAAVRQGILDSKEDLDVLLLARELDAAVVTDDDGMRRWAEQMGLKFVEAKRFQGILEDYLKNAK